MPSRLNINNLPTPKEETWKYTNLPRALSSDLKIVTDTLEKDIHIPRGQVCAQLEDVLWKGEKGQHLQPVLNITLEDNAELHIFERHEGDGAYWKNMMSDIKVGANAKLYHYRLQEDSDEAVHTNMVSVELGKDATYNIFSLNSGAKLSRHQVDVRLLGSNTNCTINGVNLLKDKQVGDTTIIINHEAPHCESHQNYRTVLDDQSIGIFQGKVHVHQIAQKTDGYQKSDTLLLSDTAQMNTKPELEIYADDVKCSHGTTTGKLDDTPLFYLRSRGIPEAEAKNLLIQSFIGEIVDKIGDETIQTQMREKIETWLFQKK